MSNLTWLIDVRSSNIVLHMICYCVLDIPVSILIVYEQEWLKGEYSRNPAPRTENS